MATGGNGALRAYPGVPPRPVAPRHAPRRLQDAASTIYDDDDDDGQHHHGHLSHGTATRRVKIKIKT